MSVAQRIAEARKSLGMSQDAFAKGIFLSQKTIGRYESEETVPGVVALAIELVYGISAKWILTGEGPMNKRDITNTLTSFDEDIIRLLKKNRPFNELAQYIVAIEKYKPKKK